MDNDQWVKDPQSNNFGELGLPMRTRDMAKIGYLYLDYAYWDDRSIISEKWIYKSIKKHSSEYYGYNWWIKHHQGYFSYYAMGYSR